LHEGGSFHEKNWFQQKQEISIAIKIVIEKPIRIDQALIFILQPDFDFLFSIKPCLKFFCRTLVEKRGVESHPRR